jgi:hypothetical protein
MSPLLLLFFLDSVVGNSFDINVNYQCTERSPSGCTAWSQTGTIQENVACFPGDSLVLTQQGSKRLDALQIGDIVLGYDTSTGMDTYTPVRAWIHRVPDSPFEFMKLHTPSGDLEVSSMHNIATVSQAGDVDYQYATEVAAGSFLKTREGAMEMQSANSVIKAGMFAPLTRLSNFYVASNSSSPMFLVHSFAHLRYPAFWAPVYHGIMSVAEMWNSKIHDIKPTDVQYVHPIARSLQDTFSFVVDKSVRKAEVARLGAAFVTASS